MANGDDVLSTASTRPGAVTAAGVLLSVATAIILFINPLIAVLFGALTVFLFMGNQLGRIVTWVVIGISVLCLGGGQITRISALFVKGPRAESAVPPWKWDLGTALDLATLLLVVVVGLLLMTPSAHRYFRRAEDEWQPTPAPTPTPTPTPTPRSGDDR